MKYAWYMKNSGDRTWPVGSLKPNDFGLFDMQGNVYTWCQDRYTSCALGQSGKATEDREDGSALSEKEGRVLRGGGFSNRKEAPGLCDLLASGADLVGVLPFGTRKSEALRSAFL